jgi:hypothetical protein
MLHMFQSTVSHVSKYYKAGTYINMVHEHGLMINNLNIDMLYKLDMNVADVAMQCFISSAHEMMMHMIM